jgi:selenocysteine-specific elongation factor
MHVIATAGHVDHGKSTLVLSLTGMDPDRFAEEKTRGLTIDLGFAWTTLPSRRELAFVDVPGHVRFIKNMLAGVGAVDACLFVVAATEGWKPQSEEHLRILELLGITHGLVALTKVASVDEEWRQLVRLEFEEHLAGTFLAGAEIVDVDAVAGIGLDDLRAGLDRLLATTPTAADRDRPRLWVDRSFAARGSGTVVTGTLAGGNFRVDDEVAVVGGRGAGLRGRIRGLQSHQRSLPAVGPGHRVAINLTGIAHDRVLRGHAVVRPGQWVLTRTVDASLTVLAALDHDVSRRGAYQVYLGSGEHTARLRILGGVGGVGGGGEAISPGGHGLVRLHLPVAVPLLPGDRYVLRESGRNETVGGGEILDVDPVMPAARAHPDRTVERVVAERGWVEPAQLERLTGVHVEPNVAGRWVVTPAALEDATAELGKLVAGAGPLGLDVAGLTERQRALVGSLDGMVLDGGRARLASQAGGVDARFGDHPYLDALTAAPFTPPDPASVGVDRAELRELVRRGLVIERDGVWFAPTAIAEAARVIAGLLRESPDGVTVSAIRDALGTTRKYLLPLLAHLDATGVTRRRGDLRIAGPRLPEP